MQRMEDLHKMNNMMNYIKNTMNNGGMLEIYKSANGVAVVGAWSRDTGTMERRLKLYFGSRCRFEIRSAPDQGTEILISIAASTEREEEDHRENSDH